MKLVGTANNPFSTCYHSNILRTVLHRSIDNRLSDGTAIDLTLRSKVQWKKAKQISVSPKDQDTPWLDMYGSINRRFRVILLITNPSHTGRADTQNPDIIFSRHQTQLGASISISSPAVSSVYHRFPDSSGIPVLPASLPFPLAFSTFVYGLLIDKDILRHSPDRPPTN